jgi:hypothetical protein
MQGQSDQDVVIWRNCSIGAPDAETDRELLSTCFIENGCLDQVMDTESPASIIIGRTGAGKSATLIRLEQVVSNAININPSDLSFKYVENSTILKFFRDAGVNLDVFYRMLWRHVLITELLRARYNWDSDRVVESWFEGLFQKFKRDRVKARALRYLQEWGDKFWQDTEVRVKKVTEKMEADLKSSISAGHLVKLDANAKLSEEERSEILTRGSAVVNKIQMKELGKLVAFLADEVFDDPQRPFYIVIDNLDESWVSNSSKFLLIRSLIEEIKIFRKIRNVKIVAVLRQDLLEKVYNETRDGGFQEEKYESYYARLRWREKDLEALIEVRVNEVFRRKYTGKRVTLAEILPKDRGGDKSLNYILDRTFLRPRDVISFINECLASAEGKARITWATLHNAEEKYSQKRLRSVLDEWTQLFPSLRHCVALVRGLPESFILSHIKEETVDSVIIAVASEAGDDELSKIAVDFLNPDKQGRREGFVSVAIAILYHVGIIGIKQTATSPFSWVYREGRNIGAGDINPDCHFRIHKMFWREFGVAPRSNLYDPD